MSERAHSPAPFALHSRPPKGRDPGGHVIADAMGDSMGGLAYRTGDHPPEEQAANARLFTASADLLSIAEVARDALAEDLRLTVEAHCLLEPGTLAPQFATLDEVAVPVVERLTAEIARIDATLAFVRGA